MMIKLRSMLRWMPVAALAFVLASCGQDQAVRYADSAKPSALKLAIKVPEEARRARAQRALEVRPGQHAVATPLPSIARKLFIVVGPERSSPIVVPPIDFFLVPGDPIEILVDKIPPGDEVTVTFRAEDGFGNRVRSGRFIVDFVPGMLTSNDLDVSQVRDVDVFLDPDPATPPPPPPPPPTGPPAASGAFLISLEQSNKVVRLDATTSTTTTLFDYGMVPFRALEGLAVESPTQIVVVCRDTGELRRITSAGVDSAFSSPYTAPVGIVKESTGNFVVAEMAGLRRADAMSGLSSALFSPLDRPIGVLQESPGVFVVTENTTNTLSRIDTNVPSRTVIFNFSSLGRSGPTALIKDFVTGDFIVGLDAPGTEALVRVRPDGSSASVIFDFSMKSAAVFGVAQDPATGNFVVTDSQGDVTDIRADGFSTGIISFGAESPTGIIVSPF